MVAGEHRNVADVLRVLIPLDVFVQEAGDVAIRGILPEVAVVRLFASEIEALLVVAQQAGIAAAGVVQVEVHVIARPQGQRRIAPLCHHGGIGIFAIQHLPDVLPNSAGAGLSLIVVLDQGGSHVHAEAVAAVVQPKAHDVLHGLPGGDGVGMVDGHLPGLVRLQETVVQRRLALEEIQDIGAVALALAADKAVVPRTLKAEVSPDIPVGILVFISPLALAEPLMFFAGVSRNQVQQHTDASPVGLAKQSVQVVVGTVARSHLLIVAHVVTGVLEGRIEAGIDPKGVAAQRPDVIQLFNDAVEIANAIGVSVVEGLRIDLIKNCIIQPLGRHTNPPLSTMNFES